jgi:hypothetical protein
LIAGYREAWICLGFPPTLSGDFNHDGSVDAADYIVWRNNSGGIYGPNDYTTWRAHFGQTSALGAAVVLSASANASLPEPSTLLLTLIVAAMEICFNLRCRNK